MLRMNAVPASSASLVLPELSMLTNFWFNAVALAWTVSVLYIVVVSRSRCRG
jgi:hypothetical protein